MLENTACGEWRLRHRHFNLYEITLFFFPTVENAVGSELVDANELHICLVPLHSEDLLVR